MRFKSGLTSYIPRIDQGADDCDLDFVNKILIIFLEAIQLKAVHSQVKLLCQKYVNVLREIKQITILRAPVVLIRAHAVLITPQQDNFMELTSRLKCVL